MKNKKNIIKATSIGVLSLASFSFGIQEVSAVNINEEVKSNLSESDRLLVNRLDSLLGVLPRVGEERYLQGMLPIIEELENEQVKNAYLERVEHERVYVLTTEKTDEMSAKLRDVLGSPSGILSLTREFNLTNYYESSNKRRIVSEVQEALSTSNQIRRDVLALRQGGVAEDYFELINTVYFLPASTEKNNLMQTLNTLRTRYLNQHEESVLIEGISKSLGNEALLSTLEREASLLLDSTQKERVMNHLNQIREAGRNEAGLISSLQNIISRLENGGSASEYFSVVETVANLQNSANKTSLETALKRLESRYLNEAQEQKLIDTVVASVHDNATISAIEREAIRLLDTNQRQRVQTAIRLTRDYRAHLDSKIRTARTISASYSDVVEAISLIEQLKGPSRDAYASILRDLRGKRLDMEMMGQGGDFEQPVEPPAGIDVESIYIDAARIEENYKRRVAEANSLATLLTLEEQVKDSPLKEYPVRLQSVLVDINAKVARFNNARNLIDIATQRLDDASFKRAQDALGGISADRDILASFNELLKDREELAKYQSAISNTSTEASVTAVVNYIKSEKPKENVMNRVNVLANERKELLSDLYKYRDLAKDTLDSEAVDKFNSLLKDSGIVDNQLNTFQLSLNNQSQTKTRIEAIIDRLTTEAHMDNVIAIIRNSPDLRGHSVRDDLIESAEVKKAQIRRARILKEQETAFSRARTKNDFINIKNIINKELTPFNEGQELLRKVELEIARIEREELARELVTQILLAHQRTDLDSVIHRYDRELKPFNEFPNIETLISNRINTIDNNNIRRLEGRIRVAGNQNELVSILSEYRSLLLPYRVGSHIPNLVVDRQNHLIRLERDRLAATLRSQITNARNRREVMSVMNIYNRELRPHNHATDIISLANNKIVQLDNHLISNLRIQVSRATNERTLDSLQQIYRNELQPYGVGLQVQFDINAKRAEIRERDRLNRIESEMRSAISNATTRAQLETIRARYERELRPFNHGTSIPSFINSRAAIINNININKVLQDLNNATTRTQVLNVRNFYNRELAPYGAGRFLEGTIQRKLDSFN